MDNANMPVTPIVGSNGRVQPFTDDNGFSAMATGLTKREAFAMAAMQGMCGHTGYCDENWQAIISKNSVEMADLLLKELAK